MLQGECHRSTPHNLEPLPSYLARRCRRWFPDVVRAEDSPGIGHIYNQTFLAGYCKPTPTVHQLKDATAQEAIQLLQFFLGRDKGSGGLLLMIACIPTTRFQGDGSSTLKASRRRDQPVSSFKDFRKIFRNGANCVSMLMHRKEVRQSQFFRHLQTLHILYLNLTADKPHMGPQSDGSIACAGAL